MNIRKIKATGSDVVYFCKDCEKLVSASKESRRYVYICPLCGTKNVAFGTEKSIRNFYHIREIEQSEKVKN